VRIDVTGLGEGIGLLAAGGFGLVVWAAVAGHRHLWRKYGPYCQRIFEERPLFIIPRGRSTPDAEDVTFPTDDGLRLRGCYLKAAGRRKGVILFGLEFGSNRWACLPYVEDLVAHGYDVFAYEPRNQGDSDKQEGYEPLQWPTDRDAADARAALAHLKSRPDADPRGVGLFGISKGGVTGLIAAADDPAVRCFVTDGIYGTRTTMVPYMQKWLGIYSTRKLLQQYVPNWYLWYFAGLMMGKVSRERGVGLIELEPALARLGARPFLMIHGGGDTYIKPEMAESLLARVRGPKEFWLIDKAKHNQSLHVAGDEYKRRVRAFFDAHLAAAAALALAAA
jgi:pimeloyl-ACP methyl ester carboxylesterase